MADAAVQSGRPHGQLLDELHPATTTSVDFEGMKINLVYSLLGRRLPRVAQHRRTPRHHHQERPTAGGRPSLRRTEPPSGRRVRGEFLVEVGSDEHTRLHDGAASDDRVPRRMRPGP